MNTSPYTNTAAQTTRKSDNGVLYENPDITNTFSIRDFSEIEKLREKIFGPNDPALDNIIEADLEGLPPFEKDREGLMAVKEMVEKLV